MSQVETRRLDRPGSCVGAAPCALAMGLVVGLLLLSVSHAWACNTPVYRYAMYNWAPSPYFVFHVHYGEPADGDTEVRQMIDELAQSGPAVANLVLEEVDLSLGHFDRLPAPVQDAWLSHIRTKARDANPLHLVFTSWGAKLHVGRLDEATVRAMVDSPVRAKIGELLNDGCATVMVLLPGSNAEENEQAEKLAQEVIAQAASGQIPVEAAFLDTSFSQMLPAGEDSGAAESEQALSEEERLAAASRLKVGLVKIDPSDQAEKWLVSSLMAMEDDLGELTEHPMIFFVYGRGRAMPPYVGKGITTENLTGEIQFLASACSCVIKDQSPGVDLIMHWDWEATADAMAAKDPTMSGGLFAYEEFSPDETGTMVPSTEPGTTTEVALADPGPQAVALPGAEQTAPAESALAAEAETSPTADTSVASAGQPQSGSEALEVRAPKPSGAGAIIATLGEEKSASFAAKQAWTLGIGLAVVAVIVLGLGSVWILKRNATAERPLP